MVCPRCQQDAPSDAAFCPKCGAKLNVGCPQCGAANAPDDNFCRKCGAARDRLRPHPAATRFAAPESYTPQAPRREDPHLEGRPRRRAQAGDRALRRPQGLDGAARRPGPRGGAQAPRPGARADDGGRPPLRGHGQPGDGRRDHGALRRAARPTRTTRSAPAMPRCGCSGGSTSTRTRSSARAARPCRFAWGSIPARWSCAPSAATCTWTTPPSGRRPISPPGWSRWPSPAPRWSPATP